MRKSQNDAEKATFSTSVTRLSFIYLFILFSAFLCKTMGLSARTKMSVVLSPRETRDFLLFKRKEIKPIYQTSDTKENVYGVLFPSSPE